MGTRRALALVAVSLSSACGGFTPRVDAAGDARGESSLADARRSEGPAPELAPGGKLAGGECCAKSPDCASGHCVRLGAGPLYCAGTCDPASDGCPVGFRCGMDRICAPMSSTYDCGPQVAKAKAQPMGGCCAKKSDCVSGQCVAMAGGQYFCTVICTRQPDDCPTGYVCSTANLCGTMTTSSCTYH